MNWFKKSIILCFTGAALGSCAPSRFVQPLEKGEKAITSSLGGPMSLVPGVATIPIPFTNVTYGQGISDKVTVFGGWYPTASLFGVWQFEAGSCISIFQKEQFGISSTPMLNFSFDKWEWESKLWPNIDVNFYYNKPFNKKENKQWMFYGGFNNWFELSSTRAHGDTQDKNYLFSPQIGARIKGEKWDYNLEYKLISPGTNNEGFTISYSSILGSNGANGLYFSVYRRF